MRMRHTLIAVACLFVLAAQASAQSGFVAKPWTYDPDNTGVAAGAWVPKAGYEGHGLYLQKNGPTATNAAAGATIQGVNGIKLTELGFDYMNAGYCGAGAPRYNVHLTDGSSYFFFGCAYGLHTALGPDWTRVRFTDADAYPASPAYVWPGFGNAQVAAVYLVFDEGPGAVTLDNLDVNGVLIGKPGNSK